MFRNLMMLVCLFTATNLFAQQQPASKTTEKEDDAKIDYQQMGAPLPPLKLFLFHDTSAAFLKKMQPAATAPVSSGNKKQNSKNRKINAQTCLNENDVKNNANLLVMIFNPGCSHCEDVTAVIQNNISLFDKSHLVMVCKPASAVALGDFCARRRICDFEAIHIGTDSSDFIGKTFVFGMLPQINIYDHARKLIKTYNGETPHR